MPQQTNELTVEQVADVLRRTPRRVRQMITTNQLPSRSVGEGNRKTYYVNAEVVAALRAAWDVTPPKRGPRAQQEG